MRDRNALRQVLVGFGWIAVPTLLLYLLVLAWPEPPQSARFIRFEPTGHIGAGR